MGEELATTLISYSERGQAYVASLVTIIRMDKLAAAGSAVFKGPEEWFSFPIVQD